MTSDKDTCDYTLYEYLRMRHSYDEQFVAYPSTSADSNFISCFEGAWFMWVDRAIEEGRALRLEVVSDYQYIKSRGYDSRSMFGGFESDHYYKGRREALHAPNGGPGH